MENKKIEKNYNLKIKELQRLNKLYYDRSKPAVNDDQYDKLKNEILLLEKKYKFLKNKNSPSKIVGYKPSKNFNQDKATFRDNAPAPIKTPAKPPIQLIEKPKNLIVALICQMLILPVIGIIIISFFCSSWFSRR